MSVQRRRRWTVAEKVRLVEEAMQPGFSVSYVARRAGIAPSQLFAWKRRMLEGGAAAVQADDDVVAAARVREREKRVRDLERMLGRKTMEAETLREALECAAQKSALAARLSGRGRFPAKALSDVLGVPRFNLVEEAGKTLFRQPSCITPIAHEARRYGPAADRPAPGRRAADLWLPPHHRSSQPRAAQRRTRTRKPQARAEDHAGEQPRADAAHGTAPRPNA